jgi:hypothetical protein
MMHQKEIDLKINCTIIFALKKLAKKIFALKNDNGNVKITDSLQFS